MATDFWARKQAEKPVRELRSVPSMAQSRLQALSFATFGYSKNPASQ